jgi:crossover junction endodeoxyribonuclease RusA
MTRIALPWPDKRLSPNARTHFMHRSRVAKIAKMDAATLAYAAGKPALPDAGHVALLWTLCPPDKRPRDMDNVIASLKHAQDGVALAWGVNDARFQPTYRWGDPVRGGAVIVEVAA